MIAAYLTTLHSHKSKERTRIYTKKYNYDICTTYKTTVYEECYVCNTSKLCQDCLGKHDIIHYKNHFIFEPCDKCTKGKCDNCQNH